MPPVVFSILKLHIFARFWPSRADGARCGRNERMRLRLRLLLLLLLLLFAVVLSGHAGGPDGVDQPGPCAKCVHEGISPLHAETLVLEYRGIL